MRTPLRTLRLAAAAAALALAAFAAAPVEAQSSSTTRRPPAVPATNTLRAANQALIDQALRQAGFRPGWLTPRQQDALDDAWADLLPEASPRRYRLNRAQATALVYLALVHDDDHYDDRPGPGYPGPGHPGGDRARECREMDQRAYALGNIVDAEGASFFLTPQEKDRVRSLAQELQRTAVSRGDRAVADRAGGVIAAVSEPLPHKDQVRPRVQSLKRALEEACGRYDRR
ncbi:MAG TPA: hypothetical protein VHG91_01350 [Longimicrobium sp.]|nr:hypothetical protein [Longimicrobium sp.]